MILNARVKSKDREKREGAAKRRKGKTKRVERFCNCYNNYCLVDHNFA